MVKQVLFVYLFVCLFVCLSVCLSVCLFVCLFLSFFLSSFRACLTSLFVCSSVYLFVCSFLACLTSQQHAGVSQGQGISRLAFNAVGIASLVQWLRRPPRERKARGSNFAGRDIPVTSKSELRWLSCQTPGVRGSVLGLVGQVSVYCDWVR